MADKSIPFINDNLGTFQVGGNVLPSTNISYSLGTPSNQWSSSYIVNMYGTASQAISASFSPGGSSATYTSSLFGTASWAINVVSSSTYNMSSSIFGTASWANNAISASYAPGSSPATYTSSLFGTASWALQAISASYSPGGSAATYTSSLFGTASWANNSVSASYSPGGSPATYTSSLFGTASWANNSISASFALNGGGGGGSTNVAYTTISTSSLNWITCSFLNNEQYVNIGTSGSYNFTCSDTPPVGQVSNAILYINNTATFTSSLSFPATWKFLGIIPTYLTTSKVAVLSLKGYGDGTVLASMTSQY